jgi:phosphate starvation-inducible protein PhoH and related proteins
LAERVYTLEIINPQIFYGANNAHINIIKSKFPKLQFVARGDEIKVLGEETELENFATKMALLEKFYIKRGEINPQILDDVFGPFNRNQGTENQSQDRKPTSNG